MTAWHALQMVPALNNAYLEAARDRSYPASAHGPRSATRPRSTAPLATRAVAKPFYGVSMLDDYPVWREPGPSAAIEPVDPMVPMSEQPEQEGGADAEEGDQAASDAAPGEAVPEKTSMAPAAESAETVVR